MPLPRKQQLALTLIVISEAAIECGGDIIPPWDLIQELAQLVAGDL